MPQVQYASEFMKAIKKSPKKTIPESAYYFTNPKIFFLINTELANVFSTGFSQVLPLRKINKGFVW